MMTTDVIILKERILNKIDRIEDKEYLQSLDAILEYENHDTQLGSRPTLSDEMHASWRRFWLRLWHNRGQA
jgi:hypothetical protein